MVMYSLKCVLCLGNAQTILRCNRIRNGHHQRIWGKKEKIRAVLYSIFSWELPVSFDLYTLLYRYIHIPIIFQCQFQCRRYLRALTLKPSSFCENIPKMFARLQKKEQPKYHNLNSDIISGIISVFLFGISASPLNKLSCAAVTKSLQVTGVSVPYLRVALGNSCWILSTAGFKITYPKANVAMEDDSPGYFLLKIVIHQGIDDLLIDDSPTKIVIWHDLAPNLLEGISRKHLPGMLAWSWATHFRSNSSHESWVKLFDGWETL